MPRPSPPKNEVRRLPPLLRRAWYGLNQAFRQRVAHLNLTPDQFSILRWLSEGDAAGLTQRDITELMASDPNTITSTLSRMEKAGMISRHPHERDRRANRVQIREHGKTIFAQAREIAMELQVQILQTLPETRRERFLRELEQVAAACGAVASEGVGGKQ